MAIVNWKRPNAGLKIIPIMENGKAADHITLVPGHNIIDDKIWDKVKITVYGDKDGKNADPNAKYIVEVKAHVVKEVESKDGKVKKEKSKEKEPVSDLNGLEPNEASEVIQNTYAIKALTQMQKTTKDDALRLEVANRLDEVRSKGQKKK